MTTTSITRAPASPAPARTAFSRRRTLTVGALACAFVPVLMTSPGHADAGRSTPAAPAVLGPATLHSSHRDGWASLPPIDGGPRQEHSTVAIGRDVYVIAGVVPDATAPGGVKTTSRVEVYNTQRRTWSKVAPLPIAMNHPNATAVDGKLYVLGGLGGGASWHAMRNSYVYNPRTNAWSTLTPMPTGTQRGSAVMGASGTTIYLAGGLRTLVPAPGGLQDTVNTVTSYNVATRRWTTLPSMPQARDHAGGALLAGTFYVIGGRDHGQANSRATVYAFDLRTRRWTERAPMPTARGSIAAAAVGTTIYTFGGEGNPAAGSNGVFPQVEAYDSARNTWRQLAPMPVPRHGTSAATVGRSIYLPGGGGAQGAAPLAINQSYQAASGPCR